MKWFLSCLGAILFLSGCGGSSSGTLNLFTGTWTGPWSSGADTGTATLHITGINSVSGTIIDSTSGQTYLVSGTLTTPSSHVTHVTLTESNNGNLVVFSGTITQNSASSAFSGTLTDIGNTGDTFTINLNITTSG